MLYSAAGNSGDMLYYDHDLYAWNFEVGTSFQPEWDEAYEQMMEFSNGVVELYDVAREWDLDRRPPRSSIDQPGSGRYDAPVEVTFDTNEPADVYYTLDGSRPDWDSTRWESAGVREGGEGITIDLGDHDDPVVLGRCLGQRRIALRPRRQQQPRAQGADHRQLIGVGPSRPPTDGRAGHDAAWSCTGQSAAPTTRRRIPLAACG